MAEMRILIRASSTCRSQMAAICPLLPLPAHRTAGAAHTGGREVGSFEMAAGAAPKPERRARPTLVS